MADQRINQFAAAGAISSTDLIAGYQTNSVKYTFSGITTYLNGVLQIAESQVTNLVTDLSNKANTNGSNATGTWGISISGNANTATSATSATNATNATNVTGKIISGVIVTTSTITGTTYMPSAADSFVDNLCNNASTQTITLPNDTNVPTIAVGWSANYIQLGAGQLVFTPDTTVTINSFNNALKSIGQYAAVTVKKTAPNTYLITGQTTT